MRKIVLRIIKTHAIKLMTNGIIQMYNLSGLSSVWIYEYSNSINEESCIIAPMHGTKRNFLVLKFLYRKKLKIISFIIVSLYYGNKGSPFGSDIASPIAPIARIVFSVDLSFNFLSIVELLPPEFRITFLAHC